MSGDDKKGSHGYKEKKDKSLPEDKDDVKTYTPSEKTDVGGSKGDDETDSSGPRSRGDD